MIKKTIFTLLALCLCTTTLWAVGYNQTEWADSDRDAATVYTDSQTGLSFYVLDGSAVLTYAEASSSNYSSLTSLTLPETVSDGTSTYTVTKVGDYAFDHASNITGELIVPANILTLGRSAFEGCTGITSVTIDYAETALGNGNNQNWGTPFYSCSGITTVTLNRNLTQGRGVTSGYRTELFSDLTNIETVYIGENVTEIVHDLFNCNSSSSCKLATVYCYATTVPTLGSGAFDSHTGLTLHVYESLGDTYSNSDWATYFSTITNDIPDPEVEEGALKDVETGLYFDVDSEGVVSIIADKLGTYDNSNLVTYSEGYTLPEKVSADGVTYYDVTRIDDNAFDGAAISGHLVIPAHITAMGISTFKNCTGLTEVTYEYSSTAVKEENEGSSSGAVNITFEGCSNIATVNLNRNITLGSGSRHVGPFEYINGVTKVTIGENVTEIPNFLVRNTSTQCLSEVYCYPTSVPTTNFDPFGNFTSCTLYVPAGCKDTYSSASYATRSYSGDNATTWGEFFTSIEEMEGEEPEPEEGTLKDVETGLYFDVDAEGVVSIIANESVTYSNSNLVTCSEGYTLPEKVSSDGVTYYDVTRIDASAFANSSISGHLVIPATITAVGEKAFQNCTALTEVTYEYSETALQDESAGNNTGSECFLGCSGVTTVNLNRDITLGHSGYLCAPFCYNTSVTTVYIGENVTNIPDYMFRNTNTKCLATVYCYAESVPTTSYDPFGTLPDSGCTLYVPAGCKDIYSSASYASSSYKDDSATTWGDYFTNIEEMEGEGGEEPEPEEGPLCDLATGLYFDIDDNGVVSIIAPKEGVYSNDNLVATDDGAYTLPAQVSATEVIAYATEGAYDVTRVDASAFEGASISGHLVIPSTITAVGEKAFKECTGLTEVTYEYSETALQDESAGNNTGTQSFNGCSGVTTVHLNRDVTIGHSGYLCAPFCYNTSVTTVYIGEYVTKIPDYMFRNTSTKCLATVYSYASAPPTLGTAPFNDLASEHTLYVNYDDVNTYKAESSWENVFGKANIHSLTGEDPDEPEDEYAFEYEGLWYSPIFDENDEVTENCEIIAPMEGEYSGEVSIPATATNETTGATYNVTRVDASAFANSSISGHLVIPATITAVGEKAFQNCTALTEVTYEYSETALQDESAGNNTGTQSFNGCSGVTTVHLNRDVTIGHSGYLCAPFCYNTSVTTVYIGEYVTKIPDYMFRNTNTKCLATVYCYATSVPSTSYDPFGTLPDLGCTLYVPAGCKEAYDSAAYSTGSYSGDNATTWGEYFNIVEMGSEESGGTFVCDVDPADNAIISVLWQVIFTNPNGGEILCNDELSETPDFEVCNEFGDIVAVGNYVEATMDGNLEVAQALTFSETDGSPTVIEEEGTYYVSVPANVFVIYDDNGKVLYNEAMTLTYTVSADAVEEPDYTLNIEPASGSTLESLSTISISCVDGIMWNTLGWVDIAIYDGNGDELDNVVDLDEVTSSTGLITEVVLTISPTITDEGEYTIEIPEGYFLISGTMECKAITLKYTISENAGTETGIGGFSINDENVEGVYSTSGQKLNSTQKGVNIIRFSDGSVKKLYVK